MHNRHTAIALTSTLLAALVALPAVAHAEPAGPPPAATDPLGDTPGDDVLPSPEPTARPTTEPGKPDRGQRKKRRNRHLDIDITLPGPTPETAQPAPAGATPAAAAGATGDPAASAGRRPAGLQPYPEPVGHQVVPRLQADPDPQDAGFLTDTTTNGGDGDDDDRVLLAMVVVAAVVIAGGLLATGRRGSRDVAPPGEIHVNQQVYGYGPPPAGPAPPPAGPLPRRPDGRAQFYDSVAEQVLRDIDGDQDVPNLDDRRR